MGDRLWELLSTLASRRAERAASVDSRLAALEREAINAEDKLKRLYKLIEYGVAEMDDLLKDRITALKTDRDRSREALARAKCNVKAKSEVTEDAVNRFSDLMRQRIQEGETPARKAWLSSLIDRIEVDEGAIRLFGRKDVLEQCVMSGASGGPGVRTFVPKWRARKDSNLCLPPGVIAADTRRSTERPGRMFGIPGSHTYRASQPALFGSLDDRCAGPQVGHAAKSNSAENLVSN